MHHPGAQAGEFQHLVVADPLDLAGLGDEPRVGREDAFDVGVDLADVGAEDGGERGGGAVAAPAAERRDVRLRIDPLEAGDDDDAALVEPP